MKMGAGVEMERDRVRGEKRGVCFSFRVRRLASNSGSIRYFSRTGMGIRMRLSCEGRKWI